jgi:hypothetical protein
MPGDGEHAAAGGCGGVGRGKRRLTALAGGALAEEERADGKLREGVDFGSAEELEALVGEDAMSREPVTIGDRLAEAIAQEVRWLRLTGETPGGVGWDRQPAWRVRLWEHYLDEQERVAAAERAMTTW